jgi:zinc and cadmium transporter
MASLLESPTVLLVICVVVVWLASMAGGGLPALLHFSHARLQIAVSMVSGLMLGLALLHLLPHGADELGSMSRAAGWLMAGFLAMFFLQRFLPFHHHDVEELQPHVGCGHDHGPAEPYASHLDWLGVAVGLSLHSVLDGLALAAAVSAAQSHGGALALGTALAVLLHKPFCAMAVTTLVKASRASSRWLHGVNLLFALVTPVAAVVFFVGGESLLQEHPAWLGAALAFSAGTFLCIACADLLPELQFHSHDRIKLSLALLVGLGIALLIGRFGHADHAGDAHEHADHDLPAHVH